MEEEIEITQEQVNEAAQNLRERFNERLEQSGKSRAVFIVTERVFVMQTAADMLTIEDIVKEFGLDMPELIDGLVVREVASESDCA